MPGGQAQVRVTYTLLSVSLAGARPEVKLCAPSGSLARGPEPPLHPKAKRSQCALATVCSNESPSWIDCLKRLYFHEFESVVF